MKLIHTNIAHNTVHQTRKFFLVFFTFFLLMIHTPIKANFITNYFWRLNDKFSSSNPFINAGLNYAKSKLLPFASYVRISTDQNAIYNFQGSEQEYNAIEQLMVELKIKDIWADQNVTPMEMIESLERLNEALKVAGVSAPSLEDMVFTRAASNAEYGEINNRIIIPTHLMPRMLDNFEEGYPVKCNKDKLPEYVTKHSKLSPEYRKAPNLPLGIILHEYGHSIFRNVLSQDIPLYFLYHQFYNALETKKEILKNHNSLGGTYEYLDNKLGEFETQIQKTAASISRPEEEDLAWQAKSDTLASLDELFADLFSALVNKNPNLIPEELGTTPELKEAAGYRSFKPTQDYPDMSSDYFSTDPGYNYKSMNHSRYLLGRIIDDFENADTPKILQSYLQATIKQLNFYISSSKKGTFLTYLNPYQNPQKFVEYFCESYKNCSEADLMENKTPFYHYK